MEQIQFYFEHVWIDIKLPAPHLIKLNVSFALLVVSLLGKNVPRRRITFLVWIQLKCCECEFRSRFLHIKFVTRGKSQILFTSNYKAGVLNLFIFRNVSPEINGSHKLSQKRKKKYFFVLLCRNHVCKGCGIFAKELENFETKFVNNLSDFYFIKWFLWFLFHFFRVVEKERTVLKNKNVVDLLRWRRWQKINWRKTQNITSVIEADFTNQKEKEKEELSLAVSESIVCFIFKSISAIYNIFIIFCLY